MKNKPEIPSLGISYVKNGTRKGRPVMKETLISTELVRMDERYLNFCLTFLFLMLICFHLSICITGAPDHVKELELDNL